MFLARVVLFLCITFMFFPLAIRGFTLYKAFGFLLVFVAFLTLGRSGQIRGALKNPYFLAAFGLLAAGLLGSLHFGSVEPEQVWKMIQNIFLLLVIMHIVREVKDFKLVLTALALGGVLTVITGLREIAEGSGARVVGIMGNPNGYGQASTMACICLMGLAAASHWRVIKFGYFCLAALCMVGLIYSGSRGASLAFLAAVPGFMILKSTRKIAILFAVMGGLSVVFIAPEKFFDRWDTAFKGQKFAKVSATEDRLELASRGWQVFMSYPVAGVGFGNVREGMAQKGLASMQVTHSVFLQTLSETGSLGFIAFGFLLVGTLVSFYKVSKSRRLRPEAKALTATIFVLLIGVTIGQNISGNYVHPIWYVLFAMGQGLLAADLAEPGPRILIQHRSVSTA